MGEIRSIETEYNGYRFRSRLEARWAVFFDALGVDYEYEPEGFELSTGGYLPDFFLRDFDIYVEIKPFRRDVVRHVGDGNKWERKCETFRDEVGKAIMICYDDPSHDLLKMLFAWDQTDSSGGPSEFEADFMQHRGELYVVARDARSDRNICTDERFGCNDHVLTAWEFLYLDKFKVYRVLKAAAMEPTLVSFDPKADDVLNRAKKITRQARFEHGETPDAKKIRGCACTKSQ